MMALPLRLGRLARQCPLAPPLSASPEHMEVPIGIMRKMSTRRSPSKTSTCIHTPVPRHYGSRYALLYEMLQTTFRGELGLVGAVVEQSVGAVKDLTTRDEESNGPNGSDE